MASLLSKFRISFSDLTMIPDITKKVESEASKTLFNGLIKPFQGVPDDSGMPYMIAYSFKSFSGNERKKYICGLLDNPDMVIGDAELLSMKEKTNRHMRLRELLFEHSANSNLIVM